MNSNLKIDSQVIGRFPRFPLKKIETLLEASKISDKHLFDFLENPTFQEAVLFADPNFYKECELFIQNKLVGKRKKSVRESLLRFAIRSSSRPTPFGFFAGVSLGQLSNKSEIHFEGTDNITRKFQFDLSILENLVRLIESDIVLKERIRWKPNSTLYMLGDEWRYYKLSKNTQRDYSLDAFKNIDHLNEFFQFTQDGKTSTELLNYLLGDGFNKIDSVEFINDLISSQILVSELEPTLTIDYFERIKEFLRRENFQNLYVDSLNSIITNLNKNNYISLSDYDTIIETLDLSLKIKEKHLLHCDYYQKMKSFQFDKKLISPIVNTLNLIGTVNELKFKKSPLVNFKRNFLQRYGARHVKLSEALDINSGLGIFFTDKHLSIETFLEDVHLPNIKPEYVELVWDGKAKFLNNLVQDFLLNPSVSNGIDLECVKQSDEIGVHKFDFDSTCSLMINLLGLESNDPIFLESVSVSNTISMTARFGDLSNGILDYLKRSVEREKRSTSKLNAELVYLPENRSKNVLRRPSLYDYEIPYLASSGVDFSKQIFVEDLYLFIKDGQLHLYSKKINSEINPVISNAHNFTKNTLPIYRFLAAYGSRQSKYNFTWGVLTEIYNFLPRVFFKNIIVALARWKFRTDQLIFRNINEDAKLLEAINDWRTANRIPQWIQVGVGDRILPLNLDNQECIGLFLSYIKDKEEFVIEEYLYKSDTLNVKEPVSHVNQIIISLYNDY